MKRTISMFIAAIFLFACFSCGEGLIGSTEERELRSMSDKVGEAHNEALDMVYRELRVQKNGGRLPDGIGECRDFIRNTLDGCRLASLDAEITLSGDRRGTGVPHLRSFAKSASNADIVDELCDSLYIVEKYRALFDSAAFILDTCPGAAAKAAELEKLYAMAEEAAENEEEAVVLMYTLSTLTHSAFYWEEHMGDWEELLRGGMAKPQMGIVGAIGIIDGAGAVVGTAEGFRDTQPGEEGRARKIIGKAVGEAANASLMATLAIILL